jgi:hypothetical protein
VELLLLFAVPLLSTGEVEFPMCGDVEERISIVHVQDWIFKVAAVEGFFRDLYQ